MNAVIGIGHFVGLSIGKFLAEEEKEILSDTGSPNKYYGFLNTFKYDKEKVSLDKYTIIESDRTRKVYNWLQYFTPEDLGREFIDSGFSVKGFYSDVAGTPYDRKASEFAIVTNKA